MAVKRKKKINILINPDMPQPDVSDTEVRQDDPEKQIQGKYKDKGIILPQRTSLH